MNFVTYMKNYVKGGIIGIVTWILLVLIFKISGLLISCEIPTDAFGNMMIGITCWNFVQEIILDFLSILSFPFLFLGANPNLSTGGPGMVRLFWAGSLISLIFWGMLIGWVFGKIKSKKE